MAHRSAELAQLITFLDARKVRVTPIRRAILSVLAAFVEPLRAEDVHARLATPKPDLVTVYRTLELFSTLGLVRPVRFHEDSARYELSDAVRQHHHHHVCVSCGKITDVPTCIFDGIPERVEKEARVTVTGHMLELFGLCTGCRIKPAGRRGPSKPRATA